MIQVVRVPRALRRRRLAAWVGVGILTLGCVAGILALGDIGASSAESLRALFGDGDARLVRVVQGWRLPRAVLAVLIGALLAWSGALFQTITANPLGSPDILGFSAGSFTGVLLAMNAGALSVFALTSSALVGGLITAGFVFGLTARNGLRGFALLVTGIGVAALLGGVNLILTLRADEQVAHAAAVWALGTLNGVSGTWVLPACVVFVLVALALAQLAPALTLFELGEDRSATLGVRPRRLRLQAMLIGIVALAVATAITGPIAFIALAAPQIARRVWRTGTIPLAATALMGALLLTLSDVLAARLFAPTILPTGMVTVTVGGVYLAWMLTQRRAAR